MHNKHVLLIGESDTKRTKFFMKAAEELAIRLEFTHIPIFSNSVEFPSSPFWDNCAVKIDPPLPNSVFIDEISTFGRRYTLFLEKADTLSKANKNVQFLNAPKDIANTLDKLHCKRVLENAGVSTTPSIPQVESIIELRALMSERHINGVFIKPRYGSGAAGIIAFRRTPNNRIQSKEVAYTTIIMSNGRLGNSRKMQHKRTPYELETLINGVLNNDAIIERWIPKAHINSNPYDICVVWQFGKIEFIVARASKGAITNLHLGNTVMDIDELQLGNKTLYEIENLCRVAMRMFPGLQSAGIDVLLENNTLRPYIIEINGQGDLIYKDIEGENKIYKSQLIELSKGELNHE
jgi:glutathione synthase/RimK-type ligase-like ATP-grasp enzyme